MMLPHSPQTTSPPGAAAVLSSQNFFFSFRVKVRFLSSSMLWPHGSIPCKLQMKACMDSGRSSES